MSYQDELREKARKRAKRDQINKIIILCIFLILVLAGIHFLGSSSKKEETKSLQIETQIPQEQSIPSVDETK
jgi:flagellar basal body-associated protein FliL